MNLRLLGGALLACVAAPGAWAVDVPVTGLKLIIVSKPLVGQAKAVFVAKDSAITKGAETDEASILAELGIAYDSTSGVLTMPPGSGWLVNKESVAKYVNKNAPVGGSVKVSVVKPGLLVKVVGKSLGETPIDISLPPSGDVYVEHGILNGSTWVRHCTRFGSCSHKAIAGNTGFKLVCKGDSSGDPSCLGAPQPACCEIAGPDPVCTWVPSAVGCAAVGGTPGAPGSSCDAASGTCTSVPGPGSCCGSIPTVIGTICAGGPGVLPETCGAVYAPSGVCTASGSCS